MTRTKDILVEELDLASVQCTELQEENTTLKARLEALVADHEALRQKDSERFEGACQQLTEMEQEIAELQNANDALSNEVNLLKANSERLVSELEAKNGATKEELDKAKHSLETALNEAEKRHGVADRELAATQDELLSTQEQLTALSAECESLRSSISELKKAKDNISQDLEVTTMRSADLANKNTTLEDRIASIMSEHDEMRRRDDQRFEGACSQLSDMEQEIMELQNVNDSLCEEVAALKTRSERLEETARRELNDLEEALQACQEELETSELHKKALEASLQAGRVSSDEGELARELFPTGSGHDNQNGSSVKRRRGLERDDITSDLQDEGLVEELSSKVDKLRASQSLVEELRALQEAEAAKNADLSNRIEVLETTISLLESAKDGLEGQVESFEGLFHPDEDDFEATKAEFANQLQMLEDDNSFRDNMLSSASLELRGPQEDMVGPEGSHSSRIAASGNDTRDQPVVASISPKSGFALTKELLSLRKAKECWDCERKLLLDQFVDLVGIAQEASARGSGSMNKEITILGQPNESVQQDHKDTNATEKESNQNESSADSENSSITELQSNVNQYREIAESTQQPSKMELESLEHSFQQLTENLSSTEAMLSEEQKKTALLTQRESSLQRQLDDLVEKCKVLSWERDTLSTKLVEMEKAGVVQETSLSFVSGEMEKKRREQEAHLDMFHHISHGLREESSSLTMSISRRLQKAQKRNTHLESKCNWILKSIALHDSDMVPKFIDMSREGNSLEQAKDQICSDLRFAMEQIRVALAGGDVLELETEELANACCSLSCELCQCKDNLVVLNERNTALESDEQRSLEEVEALRTEMNDLVIEKTEAICDLTVRNAELEVMRETCQSCPSSCTMGLDTATVPGYCIVCGLRITTY
eukprot:Nitzschia sp. Nitz4//scaffold224_size33420//30574//33377//NITZ4_007892-RA/size33420-augustus-gene-0.45-mRNA-1//-1//CDS//3329542656//8297//frame0